MNDKYLPVGSVVTLKEATKKLMIIGYLPMSEDNKVFDYNACTFPEGVLDPDKTLAFNHDKIATIDYVGLANEEYKTFNEQVKVVAKGVQQDDTNKLERQNVTSFTTSINDSNKAETLDFNQNDN